VTIESDFFIASGVVFRNDAPRPEEKRNPQGKDQRAEYRQHGASKATFYKCTIDGGQGALYDHS